jgi:hypothetical protein
MVLILAGGDASYGRVWQVELDGSGDFTDIQPAVEAAAPGDTIMIGPGRFDTFHDCVAPAWTEDAIVALVQDDLTFIGAGQDQTFIGPEEYYYSNAADPKAFCSVDGYSARIQDLTVENIEQGIYWWRGKLEVSDCSFSGGVSSRGLLLFLDGGTIENCQVDIENSGVGIGCGYTDSLNVVGCVFQGPGMGFSTGAGVGEVNILNCQFRGNSNGLVFAYGCFGKIRNVEILGTLSQALQIWYNDFPVELENIHIDGGRYGLIVDGVDADIVRGTSVIVENTTIEAIWLAASANVFLQHSHILPAEGIGVHLSGYLNDYMTLDFTGNYWGTSDPDSIAAMIVDSNDDSNIHGTVLFEPFADGPLPTEKKSLGGVRAMFR